MMTPVCIKLHNFKKFKVEHEGQLYELAATSGENLLSEFQKYKPEVKQLLVARPMVPGDFDGLAEGSVVFASTQSYITEAQMQANENGLLALEYKSPTTTTYSAANTSYTNPAATSPCQATHNPEQKLRSDLSMVDNFCSPPHGFVEAVPDPGPIDTIEIARRVREILERYKISQSLFSKYVIRRSQGTTSDLLRSPKQWDRMSEEGRTPYRRMKAWLEGDLTHNIQMLVRIKQGIQILGLTNENSHEVIPPTCFSPKGLRTKFTDEQRESLEDFFSQNPRLTHETLESFSRENNLTISAVRNWVNNRKQRMKRNYSSGMEEEDDNHTQMDKHLRVEGEEQRPGGNAQDNLVRTVRTHESNDNDCPSGVPTMVNTPMFNHETDNIADRMKSEQENHVFEPTVGKTEPDLEKYFPLHPTAWEKNNPP